MSSQARPSSITCISLASKVSPSSPRLCGPTRSRADGLAMGELREGGAIDPVRALGDGGRERLGLETGGEPPVSPTASERAADRDIIKRGLAHCARHGITSFHNMDGNFYQLDLLDE